MKNKPVLLLLIVIVLSLVMSAYAPMVQDGTPTGLDAAWLVFGSLVGLPAFLVAAINLLKIIRVIPDGAAGTVFYWANVVAFVAVALFVFTGRLDIVAGIDATLAGLAKVIAEIVILLGGLTASVGMGKFYSTQVRGAPLIGYSHSL